MGERISYLAKSSMTTTSTKVFTPCVNDKSKDIKIILTTMART
jgi:hypothetical protein